MESGIYEVVFYIYVGAVVCYRHVQSLFGIIYFLDTVVLLLNTSSIHLGKEVDKEVLELRVFGLDSVDVLVVT